MSTARDAAKFDTATFDHSRYDALTSEWEDMFREFGAFQSLTVKRASWMVSRDSTTGHRIPTYSDITIDGLLVERGGVAPSFAGGYIVRNDAELWFLGSLQLKDHVIHPVKNTWRYEVIGPVDDVTDPEHAGGVAYRFTPLHRLPFRR